MVLLTAIDMQKCCRNVKLDCWNFVVFAFTQFKWVKKNTNEKKTLTAWCWCIINDKRVIATRRSKLLPLWTASKTLTPVSDSCVSIEWTIILSWPVSYFGWMLDAGVRSFVQEQALKDLFVVFIALQRERGNIFRRNFFWFSYSASD